MRRFLSRKFLVAVFSALFIILNEGLGLGVPQEAYGYITGIVIAYIAAQGAVDYSK